MTSDDIPKVIAASLASFVLQALVLRIIVIPDKTKEDFNEVLITEDEEKIKEG